MTTTFFLIRHAAHDNVGCYLAGRMDGVSLGPAGQAQALQLASRMAREPLAAICSSPRERTLETARPIATACGVNQIAICHELDEIDFGAWSGKTFEELNDDAGWRMWNDERQIARTPSGETMHHVQQRVVALMDALCETTQNQCVALVSHADVIKAAVCRVLGLQLGDCFRFDIEPASVTTIVYGHFRSYRHIFLGKRTRHAVARAHSVAGTARLVYQFFRARHPLLLRRKGYRPSRWRQCRALPSLGGDPARCGS
jgi:probable phosphoglycerate mutase